jgi:membrane protein DedA with SNARE-associated domain
MSAFLPCLFAIALAAAGAALGYWAGRRHERALLTGLLSPEKWWLH